MALKNMGLGLLSTLLIFILVACGNPESEQANVMHLDRAKAYQDQGQYKAAMIEYKNAVKKSNANEKAIVPYADMFNTLGQNTAALNMAFQLDDDTSTQSIISPDKFISDCKKICSE